MSSETPQPPQPEPLPQAEQAAPPTPAPPPPATVLEFRGVTVPLQRDYSSALRNVSFILREKELMLLKMDWGRDRSPLGLAAQGLGQLDQGDVLFEGRNWKDMSIWEREHERARIGRVYDRHGWISNLSVEENIYLAQDHLTDRSLDELEREASIWAKRFHLTRIPRSRPVSVAAGELRRLQWVRAFYCRPKLLILERPLHGLGQFHLAELIAATNELREQSAAAIWITTNEYVWTHPQLNATKRYLLINDRLQLQKEIPS